MYGALLYQLRQFTKAEVFLKKILEIDSQNYLGCGLLVNFTGLINNYQSLTLENLQQTEDALTFCKNGNQICKEGMSLSNNITICRKFNNINLD